MSAINSDKTSTAEQKGNANKTAKDYVGEVISISDSESDEDDSVSVYPVVSGYLE